MTFEENKSLQEIATGYIEHTNKMDELVDELQQHKIQLDLLAIDLLALVNKGMDGLIKGHHPHEDEICTLEKPCEMCVEMSKREAEMEHEVR